MLCSFICSLRDAIAWQRRHNTAHSINYAFAVIRRKQAQNALKGATIDRRLSCALWRLLPLTTIADDNDVPRRRINISTSRLYTSTSSVGTMPPDLSVPLKPRSQLEHNRQDYESMLRRGTSMLYTVFIRHVVLTLMTADLIIQASFSATANTKRNYFLLLQQRGDVFYQTFSLCLSVCLFVFNQLHKKSTDRILMKILSYMNLWTLKSLH